MKDLVTKINEAAAVKTMDCKLGPFVCSVAMVFPTVHTYTKEELRTAISGVAIWDVPKKWAHGIGTQKVDDEIVEFITTNWDADITVNIETDNWDGEKVYYYDFEFDGKRYELEGGCAHKKSMKNVRYKA